MDKKTHNLLKSQIFSFVIWLHIDKASEKKKNIYIYIYMYIYWYIYCHSLHASRPFLSPT